MTSRLGLTFPVWPTDVRTSCDIARRAESIGYTDGWSAETAGPDGLAVATALGAVTETLRIGCAVIPAYTRPPALIAMGALAAQQASGGRFHLGIGASSPTIVDRWMGIPFEQPYRRVRETLSVVKKALAGEKVDLAGDTLRVRGFKLEAPPEVPVPVFLAALGPQMMKLANDEADGIALFLAAEEGVRLAAKAAPDKEIVARILCCPDEPEEDIRPLARWQLTPYIAVPAYNRFISAQGFEKEASDVARLWGDGDRQGALDAVTDELIDALVIMGPAERCKERFDSFRDAGLGTPILMLFSPKGAEGTMAAMEALAP